METSPRSLRLIAVVSGLFVALLISWSSLTYTIPSGYAGLVFRTFSGGIDPSESPVDQGFHFKAPWDRVVTYEVRQKEAQQKLDVLSSNLLKIQLLKDSCVRFSGYTMPSPGVGFPHKFDLRVQTDGTKPPAAALQRYPQAIQFETLSGAHSNHGDSEAHDVRSEQYANYWDVMFVSNKSADDQPLKWCIFSTSQRLHFCRLHADISC